jgi:hypothetical protein
MVPMPACCCARPPSSFPERAGVTRRIALLLAASLFAACSRGARAVRLPSEPDSDVYRITCRSAIAPCREKASVLCNGEYEVLENTGATIEPPRVSSAPGPRSTGSRYQRPDWVGELVVACGAPEGARREASANAATSTATQPLASAPLAQAPAPAPDQLCIPGVTQLCLGPAACRGAQGCLADGRGYGPCDCGTVAPGDAGSSAD